MPNCEINIKHSKKISSNQHSLQNLKNISFKNDDDANIYGKNCTSYKSFTEQLQTEKLITNNSNVIKGKKQNEATSNIQNQSENSRKLSNISDDNSQTLASNSTTKNMSNVHTTSLPKIVTINETYQTTTKRYSIFDKTNLKYAPPLNELSPLKIPEKDKMLDTVKENNNSGFAIVLFGVFLVIVILSGAGTFYFINQRRKATLDIDDASATSTSKNLQTIVIQTNHNDNNNKDSKKKKNKKRSKDRTDKKDSEKVEGVVGEKNDVVGNNNNKGKIHPKVCEKPKSKAGDKGKKKKKPLRGNVEQEIWSTVVIEKKVNDT